MKTNSKPVSISRPRASAATAARESGAAPLALLANLIRAYAPHDGSFPQRVPGLHVSRMTRINPACVHGLRLPCLSIIAQGAKTVTVAQEVYEYDSSRMLVYSVALPVAAQVTRASAAEPYLALRLDLEPQKIAELVLKVFPHGVPPVAERNAVYITPLQPAVTRLQLPRSCPRSGRNPCPWRWDRGPRTR